MRPDGVRSIQGPTTGWMGRGTTIWGSAGRKYSAKRAGGNESRRPLSNRTYTLSADACWIVAPSPGFPAYQAGGLTTITNRCPTPGPLPSFAPVSLGLIEGFTLLSPSPIVSSIAAVWK